MKHDLTKYVEINWMQKLGALTKALPMGSSDG